ncbi:hypothetical protein ED733_004352 [Metarhizium rileyi]|uniref:Uncharacterized protein n=1 Tax=Metarhizium rileyi (strain RCEF 4871) TaxID=1649241 RepID=A0A5C6GIX1_METRR|nr:hypothetical protein ED733_004352 [Metarhizium rileyi]
MRIRRYRNGALNPAKTATCVANDESKFVFRALLPHPEFPTRGLRCDLGRPGCRRNPSTVKKRKKRTASKEDGQNGTQSTSPSSITSGTLTPVDRNGGATFVLDSRTGLLPFPGENTTPTALATISRPLQEHWTNNSVPIMLNVYSTLDFLHNAYRINSRDGPLIWAAHLFTRTYVTNIRYPITVHRGSERESQREIGTYLGKTLSAVNAALKEPDGVFRDDVLATVWILSNYELLVGSLGRMEQLSPWHLHTKGLYSILKARGTGYLLTLEGRMAFWPCFNMMQIGALINSTECPPESDEWLDLIRKNPFDREEFLVHVAEYITKCVRVQATILTLLHGRDFAAAEEHYWGLTEQLATAEAKVNEYIMSTDCTHEMDIYMRNIYYSAIIKGYHHLLLLANFLTHYVSCSITLPQLRAQRTYCLQMVRAAGKSIIDSVPTVLGPLATSKDKPPRLLFDALKMVWPLSAVSFFGFTTPEQKREAEAALIFIGKEAGVREALNTYSKIAPLPLESYQPFELSPEDDTPPSCTDR